MFINAINLKEDIVERFLEIMEEIVYSSSSREDYNVENELRNLLDEYDYEKMEDLVSNSIDSFDIEDTPEEITRVATHIVDEELPEIEFDIYVETKPLIEELQINSECSDNDYTYY